MNHPENSQGELIIPVSTPENFEGPRHKGTVLELAKAALREKEGQIDPVTGLKNRKAFEDTMASSLEGANPGDYSIMFFDLDGLKRVNQISYETGDGYKRNVAEAIAETFEGEFRSTDHVYAYGGDEIVVVMPRKYDNPGDADKKNGDNNDLSKVSVRAVDDVDQRIGEIAELSGMERLGVSVGWATYEQGDTPESLVGRSEAMCAEDKTRRYEAHQHLRDNDTRL